MGCRSCCQKHKLKKGLWSPEEDQKLRRYITKYGLGCWSAVPKQAGLERCGKSCRLRWINYLRPGLKRGRFSVRAELIILESHAVLGNRWSQIASKLPGRTDNEIKNFWNSHMKKKLREMAIDPNTHKPFVLNNNNIVNGSEEKAKETLGSLNGSSVSVDKILFSEWLLPSSPRHEKSAIHDIPNSDCVDIQISELQAPLDTEHRRLNSSTETTFALLPPDNYNNTHLMTLQDLCSDQLGESQWVVSHENINTWSQILPLIAVQPCTSDVNQILNSELASMSTTTPTRLYTHNKDSIQSDPTSSINTTMDNDYMNYWIQYCGGAGSCSSNGRQLQNGALSDSTSF